MLVTLICGPVSRRAHEFKPHVVLRCDDGQRKTAGQVVVGDRIESLGRVVAVVLEQEAA